jgi:[ribosomal protein S5]-alanine N-acetyltransferase
MLNHMGTRVLETERLILRQFNNEDDIDFFHNVTSDEEVAKFMRWGAHKSVQDSREILDMWISGYDNNESYNWAVELKQSRNVIGYISLINIDNSNENCEVGFCIGKLWWNKGLVTEAFSEIINFAFKSVGFERLTGRHHVDNIASGKVMENCGLKYEGTLRKIFKINTGMLTDCKYYSILKGEFLH